METKTDKLEKARETQRLIRAFGEYIEKGLSQKLYGEICLRLVCEAGKVKRIEKSIKETMLISELC